MEIINSTTQSLERIINPEDAMRSIIAEFDNPFREGLIDTPKRYIKFLRQFLTSEKFNFTTFEGEGMDEMILVKDIPFFSLCEHHLAPFFGVAAIAYIPNEKIVGLSKLPRTVDMFSRRFQNQERITMQVMNFIQEQLSPKGVAVQLKARHLCVEMRGVKKHDCQTVTTSLCGVFKEDIKSRNEFLSSLK